ncbi:MAG TPA: hypothetical protein VKQ08_06745 [Cyclobacteriaceae bacterium]|nr:hypothetical protein [Cyclobacteriaceae bacterium]
MNKRRIVFLSVFGAYQVIVFLVTIFMESKKNDLSFLFDVFKKISWFKYGALVGILLLVIEFIWVRRESNNSKE